MIPTAIPVPEPIANALAPIPPASATPAAAATEAAIANKNFCVLGLLSANCLYLAKDLARSGCFSATLDLICSHLASKPCTMSLLCSMPPNLLNQTSLILLAAPLTASIPLPIPLRPAPFSTDLNKFSI